MSARKAYADHRLIVAKEEGYCVLSFDFGENILVPALVNQPGSFYFHSRRKIDVFGITNENTGQQLNFSLDVNCKLKKGPNMVLSMLHYYIFKHVEPGKTIILYADNCLGQNKNQTIVAYLCYLVQVLKRHPETFLNFMVVGHTKFSPDRHFGTLKKKIKETGCISIIDLLGDDGIVRCSSNDNFEITYKDPYSGERNFEWYDWGRDGFFKEEIFILYWNSMMPCY